MRLGTYLLAPEEEAIFCSSRKRTSRLCGRESSGECSSELLLDALDEDSGAGNQKQAADCDLRINPRREGFAAEIPDAQGPQIPAGMDQLSQESHKPALRPCPASSTDLPRHSASTAKLWASHPPRSSGESTFRAAKARMLPSGESPAGIRQPYS